jgi:hypothetical protein
VRVDAERDVGLSMAEAVLNVDDGEVHCYEHARVAVPEIVQRGVRHAASVPARHQR